ncbi:serine/threonine protein kinase [Vibrio ishigakensis]|uniref:Serine/threonine protein kinase n=1 Tax=Vibrio ishigakensis TaxID=1481914 RepID=A0A0B8NZA1_9VIBR|nr:serine/threonine protein kinase [Vibrio ishigakensis]
MQRLFLFSLLTILSAGVYAAGSGSSFSNLTKSEKLYNQGVELMRQKEFREAERKFRRAIKRDKEWAEAHNNLAYVLRKQGEIHYNTALFHYNKAIEINPKLSEPYMYRGVLYVQMGNEEMAEEDLARLNKMSPRLAKELSYVIDNGKEKEPEQFFGVSEKIND